MEVLGLSYGRKQRKRHELSVFVTSESGPTEDCWYVFLLLHSYGSLIFVYLGWERV